MSTDCVTQLGRALEELETSVSLLAAPEEWLRVNMGSVQSIVEDSARFKFSDEEQTTLTKFDFVYPVRRERYFDTTFITLRELPSFTHA